MVKIRLVERCAFIDDPEDRTYGRCTNPAEEGSIYCEMHDDIVNGEQE